MKKNNFGLVFLPLGGVGEIGMNLSAYGYGHRNNRKWIIIDMGITFAGPDFPGVDFILPDISFFEKEKKNILAIILTHAHEDHCGAVLDLWPKLKIPIYCTAFTGGLLESKQEIKFYNEKIPLKIFKEGQKFTIEDFDLEAIAVTHSTPDSIALVIRTDLGTILHTGDWKIDNTPSLGVFTDENKFREIGKKGVLALVCDSTNAMFDRPCLSEHDVSKVLEKIIIKAPGRVAITTFSSNIDRIKSIVVAAKNSGRNVLLFGRSVKRSISIAKELGYLTNVDLFIDEENSIPRNKIVIILTGSQGENNSALSKIARNEMKNFRLDIGDIVIYSSKNIPGNEKAIINVQNLLVERGIQVVTNNDAAVHISGHPYRDQLLKMYSWINPKVLIPIHGDASHLSAHASLGQSFGIENVIQIRNGDILHLAPGDSSIVEKVPCGRIYKDGNLLGYEKNLGIFERRKLSFVGQISVSLVLDSNQNLFGKEQLKCLGLPDFDHSGNDIKNLLRNHVLDILQNIPKKTRKNPNFLESIFKKNLQRKIQKIWGKKTIISIFLHYI